MLVLLHFHELGYTRSQLAFLFLFYELFGVVTNLSAAGSPRAWGSRVTLLGGLALQVVALGDARRCVDPSWAGRRRSPT